MSAPHDGAFLDWPALLDAAVEELGRCEVALRIVLPVVRTRIPLAEVGDLELTLSLLKKLRRIFSPGANLHA
jgi:hypothetical protein